MKKTNCVLMIIISALLFGGFLSSTSLASDNGKGAINLKFAYWVPPTSTPAQKVYIPWAKEIEKRTNNKVKVVLYGGEAMGKAPDYYTMCRMGVADIVQIEPNFTPGVFPLTEAISLPMEFNSAEVASAVLWELFEKYMKDSEFKKVKVLITHTTGISQLFSTKKIMALEDFKGVKFAATSTMLMKTINALGGAAVMMPEPDIYTSLERGLIDGRFHEWEGAWVFKMNEVTKYRTANVNLNSNTLMIIMNLNKWNSLPDDVKQIFDDVSGLVASKAAGRAFDEQDKVHLEKIISYDKSAQNPEIYYLPANERERWKATTSIIAEEWVKEKDKMGLPGTAIVKDLRKFTAKFKNN